MDGAIGDDGGDDHPAAARGNGGAAHHAGVGDANARPRRDESHA